MREIEKLFCLAAIAAAALTLAAPAGAAEIWIGPHGQYRESTDRPPAELLLKLPEDGQAYHLSICLSDDWQAKSREREIVAWFESGEPRLAGLKVQCHYHLYTEGNAIYRVRLRHRIPAVPAVVLQDSSGFVVYASCESPRYRGIPATAGELADDVADSLAAHCRARGIPWNDTTGQECDRCRPRPQPAPVHVEVKPIVPDRPLVPLIERSREAVEAVTFPWGLFAGLCAAGAAIASLATLAVCVSRRVKANR
jgi:hypothetical protein